jgi:ubiquinone/menaquinone biosynthesis methyltransferase
MIDKDIYNPEFVRNLFNEMAGTYDRVNYITSFGFSLRWRRQFISKLRSDNKNLRILDLMTGMGETWNIIQSNFPHSTIDALDYSDVMVSKAKTKVIRYKIENLTVLHDNALASNINDHTYDIVTCAFGLKTFNEEQFEILAKEVSRILKPDGAISFIEISVPKNIILKSLYGFYTGTIIPIIGKLMLGNPENYKMLWRYTVRFKNCDLACKAFKYHNFEISKESYFWGCSTGFTGRKR